jgi:group I intron endonuclease
MGVIYRLISPCGKSYIGQTIHSLEYRLAKHLQRAKADDEKPQCRALNAAIRKYGIENFQKETLVICNDVDLDDYEIKFIDVYQTLAPDGYNLTKGGSNRMLFQTESAKDKLSAAKRIYKTYILPRNVVEINYESGKRKENGFRVILNGKTYTFNSKLLTMEDKLKEALKCYETIKLGGTYEIQNRNKRDKTYAYNIPKYIVKRGDNGFALNMNGQPRKTFDFKGKTKEANLILALEYYLEKIPKHLDSENYEMVENLLNTLTE